VAGAATIVALEAVALVVLFAGALAPGTQTRQPFTIPHRNPADAGPWSALRHLPQTLPSLLPAGLPGVGPAYTPGPTPAPAIAVGLGIGIGMPLAHPVGDPLNDPDGHRGAGADGCDTMRLPARRWARCRR